ncbi:MAG: NUDIX domain-containing protein, partial [bacterium]|nr:NUDIX domain-containing protein [bacterium]
MTTDGSNTSFLRSCGVLLFRTAPAESFLLMEHADRLDLPKGHVDADETDLECALREMEEETGIDRSQVKI